MLANSLHESGFGGLEVRGNVRYESATNVLQAGSADLVETDVAAYLLLQDAALPSGAGPAMYLPVLQRWGDGGAEMRPVLVCGPEVRAASPETWQGIRLAVVDTATSVGGMAQLEWLVARGTDFRRDVRFVVAGSPADAVTRVRTGLVDVAAVPLSALEETPPGPEATVIEIDAVLLPRMLVVRSDVATVYPGLLYEVLETFREVLGMARLVPTRAEHYATERERWSDLARQVFGPRRALLGH